MPIYSSSRVSSWLLYTARVGKWSSLRKSYTRNAAPLMVVNARVQRGSGGSRRCGGVSEGCTGVACCKKRL